MYNFIEEYLQNPSLAIAKAKDAADRKFASIQVDEDEIYVQISSPDFHLYEAMSLFDRAVETEHMYISPLI